MDETSRVEDDSGEAAIWSRSPVLIGAALVGLLVVPLLVTVVALRSPQWFPFGDSAVLELRLRDVGTAQTPLLGAVGRFGEEATFAYHPGPLGLYVLSPVYRLLGSTSWATTVATVFVHAAAVATALWIAFRRAGAALALGLAAVLAILIHGYGPSLLADAWNPFVPLLWWLVFLLAIWSVLCDDLVFLPIAVATGSLCAQSHVSYMALTVGLGGFAVAWVAVDAWRRRGSSLRRVLLWSALAAGIGIVLWLPPVIEELRYSPGNLTAIWRSFTSPEKEAIGFAKGLEVMLTYLDPVTILTRGLGRQKIESASGGPGPGIAFLVVWVVAAAVTWRNADRALRRLQLVIALALGLGVLSCSRVVGDVLSYLFFWIWGVAALMALAIGWSVVVVFHAIRARPTERRIATAGAAGLLTVVVVASALTTADAVDAHVDPVRPSDDLGALIPPTVAALRQDPELDGAEGRILVTWTDPLNFGFQGFGLMNELERAGFDVGALPYFSYAVAPRQGLDREDAVAEVHFAVGPDIAKWDANPDARRIAYFEPRSPRQRAEFDRLREAVVRDLIAAGLEEEVEEVDSNLVNIFYGHGAELPPRARARMERMIDLGLDLAVFVTRPGRSGSGS